MNVIEREAGAGGGSVEHPQTLGYHLLANAVAGNDRLSNRRARSYAATAIEFQARPGDKVGLGRGQECHGIGNVARLAEPAQRNRRDDVGAVFSCVKMRLRVRGVKLRRKRSSPR
jgi:hypothetical protein